MLICILRGWTELSLPSFVSSVRLMFQYCVTVEKILLVSTDYFDEALACLIASYFVFNIIYPKAFSPVLLFFQHAIFNLMDNQTRPVSLTTFFFVILVVIIIFWDVCHSCS